jgi:hypothetical protein
MSALLEEDEVMLMLAQHHVGEARRLLAEQARARGRDTADMEQSIRSVEALLCFGVRLPRLLSVKPRSTAGASLSAVHKLYWLHTSRA